MTTPDTKKPNSKDDAIRVIALAAIVLTKLGEDWPLVPVVEDSTALRQQQLVAHAAEAAEVFDEDELEAFAAKQREGAGS